MNIPGQEAKRSSCRQRTLFSQEGQEERHGEEAQHQHHLSKLCKERQACGRGTTITISTLYTSSFHVHTGLEPKCREGL